MSRLSGLMKLTQGRAKPCTWEEYPRPPAQAGAQLTGQQPDREGLEGPGG